MRQVSPERYINIAVNGPFWVEVADPEHPFTAMLISCSGGTCLILSVSTDPVGVGEDPPSPHDAVGKLEDRARPHPDDGQRGVLVHARVLLSSGKIILGNLESFH